MKRYLDVSEAKIILDLIAYLVFTLGILKYSLAGVGPMFAYTAFRVLWELSRILGEVSKK